MKSYAQKSKKWESSFNRQNNNTNNINISTQYIMNMMSQNIEEVIKPEYIEKYRDLHEDLWRRMKHVNCNIIILERIDEFYKDIKCVYAPGQDTFWSLAYHNFQAVTVLLLRGLTENKGSDVHTLIKFKDKLLEWIQDKKLEFKDNLKTVDFDDKLKKINEKMRNFRNCVVAHRLLDTTGNLIVAEGISNLELRQVYEDSKKLFDSCCIGADYSMTFSVGYGDNPKDINHIFDLLIKDSDWFKASETPFWKQYTKLKSKESLESLNRWRKKFGMTEINS